MKKGIWEKDREGEGNTKFCERGTTPELPKCEETYLASVFAASFTGSLSGCVVITAADVLEGLK